MPEELTAGRVGDIAPAPPNSPDDVLFGDVRPELPRGLQPGRGGALTALYRTSELKSHIRSGCRTSTREETAKDHAMAFYAGWPPPSTPVA